MPPSAAQDPDRQLPGSGNNNFKGNQKNSPFTLSSKAAKKNALAKDGTNTSAIAKSIGKAIASKNAAPTVVPDSPPEMKADDPPPPNGNKVTSPLLDALSSAAFAPSVQQNTTDWAKNVPAFAAGSPGNLISLGGSPPTQPSSYDERRSQDGRTTRSEFDRPSSWKSPLPDRGSPNGYLSSASPPTRPLSFQLDGHQNFDNQAIPKFNYINRRSSMASTQGHRNGTYPPLPHHVQSHFYGAPDINLGLNIPDQMMPGDNGYYCGFDNIPGSDGGKSHGLNVIVMGYEGGVDIYTCSQRALQKYMSIDGIKGGIYGAKILPWTSDTQVGSTFIALVVHGPVWSDSADGKTGSSQPPSDDASSHPNDSARESPAIQPQVDDTPVITHYQTNVEVYSLESKKWVATLLQTPEVAINMPITSPGFTRPPPVGDLSIQADGVNIVISSSVSGEVFIFKTFPQGPGGYPLFQCLGKVWTCVHHRFDNDTASSMGSVDGESQFGDSQASTNSTKGAMVSLKGRWLAYAPAASGSQTALRAIVPTATPRAKIPGLYTFAAPQPPSANCAIDTPGGASVLNRVARNVTQEVVKGAGWVTSQGKQALSYYWNKPTATSPSNGNGFFQTLQSPYQSTQQYAQQLPPTHAPGDHQMPVQSEAALISILDVDHLSTGGTNSAAPQPLATFKTIGGCSFVSFAPSGLMLFTASTKGDVQYVWDLMRIKYVGSSILQTILGHGDRPTPLVRQVAEFSRLTSARIVDVVWTAPQGERLAMVTEHGTAHILDLPASASIWPPPRQIRKQIPADSANVDGANGSAFDTASNVLNAAWKMGKPLFNGSHPRRISASGLPSTGSMAARVSQGGKALISKSYGAASGTYNGIMKGHENKVFLPRGCSSVPGQACVKWLGGKNSYSIAVFGGGVVRIYKLKQQKSGRAERSSVLVATKDMKDHALPTLPNPRVAQAVLQALQPTIPSDPSEDSVPIPPHYRPSPPSIRRPSGIAYSVPEVEVESNAPYQPFHTDPRVTLSIYSSTSSSPSVSALLTTASPQSFNLSTTIDDDWVFGNPISTTKLDVGTSADVEDAYDPTLGYQAPFERHMMQTGGQNGTEDSIVVTTLKTRRKLDVGEEDFDDDYEYVDYADRRV